MMDSKKRGACVQMNLGGLKTCMRGFAGIEGAEGASGELAADETSGKDYVEDLGWEDWNTNDWPFLASVRA